MRPRLCLLLALVPLVAFGAASGQSYDSGSPGKAGLVTRDLTPKTRRDWRADPDHTLHVTVWYPATADAHETPQTVGPPDQPLFLAGMAAPHAAFAPSLTPFPLILLSHGSGGSALQMAWLGTALARAGFVAAAVDHPGNSARAQLTAAGFLLPWERATDLAEVLDGLLADPELAPHLDRERVGAAGFSIGGYTVLELAGARTDISLLSDLCDKQPDTTVCHVPEMQGMGTPRQMLETVRKASGESLARSADSFRDPRIRAVLAIAPALGFTQTPESLHAVHIPVALVVGSADTVAPAATNADLLKSRLRGARETTLPGVGHYTFLDACTSAALSAMPQYCTDPPGVDRGAIHAQVSDLAAQFFAHTLRAH